MQSVSLYPAQSPSISATKKISLFKALTSIKFSGEIIWKDNSDNQWVFFFDTGRLLYATGGKHPLRRWQRTLQPHVTELEINLSALGLDLSHETNLERLAHQEYAQIRDYLQNGELDQSEVVGITRRILEEVLFDLFLAKNATYTVIEGKSLPVTQNPIFINEESVVQSAYCFWEDWKKLNLDGHFPDQAPVIRQPEKIQEKTNRQLYEVLVTLLNGRNTLRDIAVKMGRDVIQITQALKTFIQLGWIDLNDISDCTPSTEVPEAKAPFSPELKNDWALIACVDDSPLVCRFMEQIVQSEGYRFLAVQEPLRAMSNLLSKKPDIIFLDLVMPYTNGYEICSQLRKVSKFSSTPIIILSGNDGVVDQVRARLMGATDFVSKPVDAEIILSKIHQHLAVPAAINP
ncbi:MAG: response regulator [Cyanobacteria bacterium J06635_15]